VMNFCPLFCSSAKCTDCNTINGIATCVDPCNNYAVLNDDWRSVNNTDRSILHCDQNINLNSWHRMFLGGNSAQIPEACVPIYRCGTAAPSWINGTHPTQADGIVSRTGCGSWIQGCCPYTTNVKVKLCYGSYYVYKLGSPSICHISYCTGPKMQRREAHGPRARGSLT
uniref:UMOD/GP2/OIT3-like D8C domain-containing protein n=1 Tax=Oryzias sinensis TaxID=183150 RepID=A0A8C7X427_9TELE